MGIAILDSSLHFTYLVEKGAANLLVSHSFASVSALFAPVPPTSTHSLTRSLRHTSLSSGSGEGSRVSGE